MIWSSIDVAKRFGYPSEQSRIFLRFRSFGKPRSIRTLSVDIGHGIDWGLPRVFLYTYEYVMIRKLVYLMKVNEDKPKPLSISFYCSSKYGIGVKPSSTNKWREQNYSDSFDNIHAHSVCVRKLNLLILPRISNEKISDMFFCIYLSFQFPNFIFFRLTILVY